MTTSWQDVAAKVADLAPIAGATLGGPLGGGIGIAIKALARVFGIQSPSPQPQEVLQAITGDPQALLKLDAARLAYEQEKMKLEYEEKDKLRDDQIRELEVTLGDIQDARKMKTEGEKSTGKRDTNLYALAWVLIAGFFILVGILLWRPVPQDSSGVIFLLFGTLASAFGAVVGFFFGSSRGSQSKDALLANSISANKK